MSFRTRAPRLAALAGGLLAAAGAWLWIGAASWPREDVALHGPGMVIALSSWFDGASKLDAAAAARLRLAADIATRRGIPRLVTTRIANVTGMTSDVGQRAVLDAAHYTGPWTILAPVVRTTREEALALASTLPGRHTVVVVTSRHHTRRACATFEAVGFEVECVIGYVDPWWQLPVAYLYERLAAMEYRRKGWIR